MMHVEASRLTVARTCRRQTRRLLLPGDQEIDSRCLLALHRLLASRGWAQMKKHYAGPGQIPPRAALPEL